MKIGIVGGGFMGLVSAYEISKTDARVTIFESNSQTGGLATYFDYDDFIWDKFYHVILPTDRHLIHLIEDIGLGSSLKWKRSLTGYYVHNKFYSISNSREFLFFSPLGIMDKAKLAYTIIYASKIKDWKKLEKISVKDWLISLGGKRTYEKFWAPLLLAKLGENHDRVSAVFIWTYIKRLFQARSSAAQKEHMGYVEGGYKTILDKLAYLLQERNSELILDTSIKRIYPDPKGGINLEYDGKTSHFDKVIFTAPLNVLEKTVAPQLMEISNSPKQVEYLGVICMVLISTKPLTPYYVLNIADDQIPFTGVIGMSTLVDKDQTDGKYLTYFPKYVTADHSYWSKSDNELKEIFLKGVHSLYPDFSDNLIHSLHINKAYKVQPLQVMNYSDIVPKVKTKHPDFYVVNTSQFVNDTLNNNSVVKHVERFMENFVKEINESKQTKRKKVYEQTTR
jgi:protoporphyrinogen oxidase